MANVPSNSLPPEEALLDYLEGDLTPEAALRIESSLKPAELARLRAMRADAGALRALGDVRAPVSLLADVADALEREMLLGVREEGESVSESLPISLVRPARQPRFWDPLFREAGVRRLALAAALLLAVGGAAFIGYTMLRPNHRPLNTDSGSPLALNTAPGTASEQFPAPAVSDAARGSVAQGPAETDSTLGAPPAGPPAEALALGPEPITLDSAAALLAEGRLIIRVRCATPEPVVQWLARVDERSTSLRISDQVPVELALAVLDTTSRPDSPDSAPAPFIVASDDELPEPIDLEWQVPGLAPVSFDPQIVLLELDADARTLASAIRHLTHQTGHEAVFERSEAPLALPAARPSAEALLWWMRPAHEWAARAVVPIVIEPLR